MSLDRFKRTIIKLDKANNRIPQVMLGKEGDYYGRELEVHLLDDGERVDTTGVDLNFQWKNLRSGEFGTLPFEEEDVAKGTYTIAYPPEMLTKGDVSCTVQIIEGESITHTMNFKVSVEGNPLDSEVLMEDNSFKALGEALVKINSLKQQFDDAVGAITEDSEVVLARELNNYKSTMASVNVNQEAKQTATGYGVVSLPKNAANGQVSVSVNGLTATNLVKNGNFTNGVGSWSGLVANLSANNGILKITKLGTDTSGGFGSAEQFGIFQNGRKYFIKCRARNVGSYQADSLILRQGSTVLLTQSSPVINTWYSLMSVFTADSTNALRLTVNGTKTESTEMEVQEVIVIDLTVNGFENKTVEELNTMFANYFDDTKSTQSAMRLKSIGKNLFDGKLEVGGLHTDTGLPVVGTTTSRSINFIRVKPNTDYSADSINRFFLYDSNKNFIRTGIGNSFQTSSNESFLRIRKDTTDISSKTMVNEGTVALPYAKYELSETYINLYEPLRSLPNGVKDEVRVSGGKAEHIQRIKKYVLQASDIANMFTTLSELDYATVRKPVDALMYDTVLGVIGTGNLQNHFEYTGPANNVDGIGGFRFSLYLDRFGVGFTKGTTVEQARTALAGTTLIYQLAEPIITPIQVSGNLISYPSGTVYVEPVVADAGIYTDKLNVLDSELPINYIEKLSKVDFNTGVETELDVSLAVMSEDGLSFTHPDLLEDDIVFFTYFYDKEGTLGETTITYYDSRHTLKDTVTGKFYKIEKSVTDGELIETLVEV